MTDRADISRVKARDVTPTTALQFGYNLYLLEKKGTKPALRDSAQSVVDYFNRMVDSFPKESHDRLYLEMLRMAGTSLAQGIFRRKEKLRAAIDDAKEQRRLMTAKIGKGEILFGFAKAAFNALLIGGFAFTLVNAIFEVPVLAEQTEGMEQNYAAIATGIGIVLFSYFIRGIRMERKILRLSKEFDKAIEVADSAYKCDVSQEYFLAAELADFAFQNFFNEAPPIPQSFRNLLSGMIGGEDEEQREETRKGRMRALLAGIKAKFAGRSGEDARADFLDSTPGTTGGTTGEKGLA